MPYNILLVDDDKEFRSELKASLEDYEVIEAVNGEESLRVLKKPNEIDLVVLDVFMPGLSGTEVLRKIKEIDSSLGVIILTGQSSEDTVIEALKGRADDYLQKPFEVEKLRESIEKLLKSKKIKGTVIGNDIEGKIEKVKLFAQRNYHKKVCLGDVAKAVYLSPKYLSRVFKQKTGIGFNEFMQHIKVNKAKEFLQTSGYNVNQISDRLGYQNPESFIRQFKKIAKNTPTEFRAKNRRIKRKQKRQRK